MGIEGRKLRLWWSGNGGEIGGVGVLANEELCEQVEEVRGMSDTVMAVVLDFEEDVLRLICGYDV